MPDESPSILKCMIKRSKFVLRFAVVIGLLYFLSMIFGIGSWFVLVIMNAMIFDSVLNVFNITSPLGEFGLLVVMVVSLIELCIIGACLSCIPFISKSVRKIFNAADAWIGLKKRETVIFEV